MKNDLPSGMSRSKAPSVRSSRMTDTEREVYRDRGTDERFFSHLLDSRSGRHVRIRTPKKVSQHLMYGVLVIAVEQTLRMLC